MKGLECTRLKSVTPHKGVSKNRHQTRQTDKLYSIYQLGLIKDTPFVNWANTLATVIFMSLPCSFSHLPNLLSHQSKNNPRSHIHNPHPYHSFCKVEGIIDEYYIFEIYEYLDSQEKSIIKTIIYTQSNFILFSLKPSAQLSLQTPQ